jgi:hypothetical protein
MIFSFEFNYFDIQHCRDPSQVVGNGIPHNPYGLVAAGRAGQFNNLFNNAFQIEPNMR